MASRLQDAKDAKARAEEETAALRQDLSELHQQVGPVTDLVEKAQRDAQLAKVMTGQRKRLLHDLVTRARNVAERLGTEAPLFSAEGDDEEAGYAGFFERFLGKLEENVASVAERVEEECRDLLSFATRRIFINLAILDPTFDYATVTAPVDPKCREANLLSVWQAAKAYAEEFGTVEVEVDEGADEEDEEASSGGEGSSGGAAA